MRQRVHHQHAGQPMNTLADSLEFLACHHLHHLGICSASQLASVTEKSPQMMLCSHFKVDQFHHTVFDLGYLYLAQQQETLANSEHLCDS